MIRSMLTVALMAGFVCFASTAFAKGDPAKGKLEVYSCHGCHGVPGYETMYPEYHVPRIAGQSEAYLKNALDAYSKGTRKHPTMQAQAQSFSEADRANLAAYLSSIKTK